MRLKTRRQETGADAGEFLVGRDFSQNPLEGGSAVSGFYTVATALVHIAMTARRSKCRLVVTKPRSCGA